MPESFAAARHTIRLPPGRGSPSYTHRQRFFTDMLRRERLFFAPWGETLEAMARANLERAATAS